MYSKKKQTNKQAAFIIPWLSNILNEIFEMVRGSLHMSSRID